MIIIIKLKDYKFTSPHSDNNINKLFDETKNVVKGFKYNLKELKGITAQITDSNNNKVIGSVSFKEEN